MRSTPLTKALVPELEERDGPITTTGSKDFPVLRQEMCSPQRTLGHLVAAICERPASSHLLFPTGIALLRVIPERNVFQTTLGSGVRRS